MAMTANTWYYVTIAPVSTPIWVGSYTVPPFVVDAITSGLSAIVFCISDAGLGGDAKIAFLTGIATVPSAAVTVAFTPAMNTSTVTSTGETWYSVRDSGGGGWLWYGNQSGVVQFMSSSGALGTFIA